MEKKMKLWVLKPAPPLHDNPWEKWYDKAFGFVIRAETEEEARKFTTGSTKEDAGQTGDEARDGHNPWLDPRYTICVELKTEGESGVILRDFRSA